MGALGTVGGDGDGEGDSDFLSNGNRAHVNSGTGKADVVAGRGNLGNGVGGLEVTGVLELGVHSKGLAWRIAAVP